MAKKATKRAATRKAAGKKATRKSPKKAAKKPAGKARAKSAKRTTGWTGAKTTNKKAPPKPVAKMGDVIWTELQSTDPAGSIKFYSALLGWKAKRMPIPDIEYNVFSSNGTPFGGVLRSPQPGLPSSWLTYFRVKSAEKSAAKAVSLGGQVIAPTFQVPTVGQMAIVQDPTGAYFALFQPDM